MRTLSARASLALWLPLVACTPAVLDTLDSDRPEDTDLPVQRASDPLWDLGGSPTFYVDLPVDDWEAALWELAPEPGDRCPARPYLEGEVTFHNPMTGVKEYWPQVGVRWRGQSALNGGENARVGLKLSFNEFMAGREFHSLRKVNIMGTEGDYSLMREHLALRVARDLGIEAPRSTYAHLYVNDVYMGFYPMSEEADDNRYLVNHFDDPTGSLFKVEGYCGGRGAFADVGPDPLDYIRTYDPKGSTPDSAIVDDLFPLIACVNDPDDDVFRDCVRELVDVENWLLEIALDVVLPDVDGMIGAGQNYMIYKRPETGKFIIWPWDKDLAMDDANLDPNWDITGVHPNWAPDFRNLLGDRLVHTFVPEYCRAVAKVMERYEPDSFVPELEEHRAFLAPMIEGDPWMQMGLWGHVTDDIVEYIPVHHRVVAKFAEDYCP
jgi:hypothetical protein